MGSKRNPFKGCYRQLQQQWTVRALKADGGWESVVVHLAEDSTVEDALLDVLKQLEIPQVALPAVCLCRTRSCTTRKRRKNEGDATPQVNLRPRGLPFFRAVSSFRRPPSRLFLRVDVDLLPRSELGVRNMLGERGMELLTHQVLSEVVLVNVTDWPPIDWACAGLRFLQKRIDNETAFVSFRDKYLTAMNRIPYGRPVQWFRRLTSLESDFKEAVVARFEALKDNKNDFSEFFENVGNLNPQVHPMRLLEDFGTEMNPFDLEAFLCQLENLQWNERSKKLTVTYYQEFAGEIVTRWKNSVSATDLSFLVRYLSLHHPAVVCEKIRKSTTVRIETRLQHVIRNFDVCPQLPVGNGGCGCQRKYHFGCTPAGLLELQGDTDTLMTDLSSFSSAETQPIRRPVEEENDLNAGDLSGQKILLRVKAKQKLPIDRLPGVENSEKAVGKGQHSEVMKGHLITENEEILFAVKRLLTERIPPISKTRPPPPASERLASASKSAELDLDNLRRLTANACRAIDCHCAPWPLLPVLGLRPERPEVLSPWIPTGSLHDLLARAKPDGTQYKVRHLLQTAAQMSVALLYLEQLNVREVGLHLRNVLVLEHSPEFIRVCLTEAGTNSLQRKKDGSETTWLNWRNKFCDSHLTDDEKDLLISLRLSTLYRPNRSFEQEGDCEATDVPGQLWRQRHLFSSTCLLLWSRRTLQNKELTDELDRDLSSTSMSKDLIPMIMRLDTDSSTILRLDRDGGVLLGKGFFGEVRKCKFRDKSNVIRIVAVKYLIKSNPTEFSKEVKIHQDMKHRHVIEFIECDEKNMLIVMPFADQGTLLEYVRKCRNMKDKELEQIGRKFCREICEGMMYLHARTPPVIHRDLALRNILLDTPDLVVKISDFGLSRLLEEDVYEARPNTNTKLPVCWLPPSDVVSQKMDGKVDVWSFGVCMWEIFTRGQNPVKFYETHINPLTLESLHQKVFDEELYLPPGNIIPAMYDIMRNRCWVKEAAERPNFAEIRPCFD